jgi:UDP-N-acetylmuramyl pentapeptide synthase
MSYALVKNAKQKLNCNIMKVMKMSAATHITIARTLIVEQIIMISLAKKVGKNLTAIMKILKKVLSNVNFKMMMMTGVNGKLARRHSG